MRNGTWDGPPDAFRLSRALGRGWTERMGDLHLGEDFNRMPLPRFRTMHTLEILSSALSFTDKTPSCAPWKWSENLDHFWPTNGRDRWKCRNPPPLKYFLAL